MATQEDPSLALILDFFANKNKTPASITKKFHDYQCEDRIHHYQDRIMVLGNKTIKEKIMRQHHNTSEVGHQGQARTLGLISRAYCWPRMKAEINQFVAACDV